MAQAAAMLEESSDPSGAALIQQRMKQTLQEMPMEEAAPIVVRRESCPVASLRRKAQTHARARAAGERSGQLPHACVDCSPRSARSATT